MKLIRVHKQNTNQTEYTQAYKIILMELRN